MINHQQLAFSIINIGRQYRKCSAAESALQTALSGTVDDAYRLAVIVQNYVHGKDYDRIVDIKNLINDYRNNRDK